MNRVAEEGVAEEGSPVESVAVSTEITPVPTDEEAVAIAAAVHALWPVAVLVTDPTQIREAAWKFSGRWWNRPIPNRRDRPYR